MTRLEGRFYRPIAAVLALTLALTACGREEPAPAPEPAAVPTAAEARPGLWFICDALAAPVVFVLVKDEARDAVRITEYDKRTGAPALPVEYALGAVEGAAGSVFTGLERDGRQVGAVRAFNPGVLEFPGSAYTTPYTSLTLGQRSYDCRWLARTRLFGFTDRRSIAITEDADGDLIYTTFNFADSEAAPVIELSGSQRSTMFSLEVRGGEETVTPDGAEYRFRNDGYLYTVRAPRRGAGSVEVRQAGAEIRTEPLLALQTGSGGE